MLNFSETNKNLDSLELNELKNLGRNYINPTHLGSYPGRGHNVVFLGKTLYSQKASLHPGV